MPARSTLRVHADADLGAGPVRQPTKTPGRRVGSGGGKENLLGLPTGGRTGRKALGGKAVVAETPIAPQRLFKDYPATTKPAASKSAYAPTILAPSSVLRPSTHAHPNQQHKTPAPAPRPSATRKSVRVPLSASKTRTPDPSALRSPLPDYGGPDLSMDASVQEEEEEEWSDYEVEYAPPKSETMERPWEPLDVDPDYALVGSALRHSSLFPVDLFSLPDEPLPDPSKPEVEQLMRDGGFMEGLGFLVKPDADSDDEPFAWPQPSPVAAKATAPAPATRGKAPAAAPPARVGLGISARPASRAPAPTSSHPLNKPTTTTTAASTARPRPAPPTSARPPNPKPQPSTSRLPKPTTTTSFRPAMARAPKLPAAPFPRTGKPAQRPAPAPAPARRELHPELRDLASNAEGLSLGGGPAETAGSALGDVFLEEWL